MAQQNYDDYDATFESEEDWRRRAREGGVVGPMTGSFEPIDQAQAFDPSRAPGDVPIDWAEDFVRRNPGDYHRISEAYKSERGGGAQLPQQATAQYSGGGNSTAPGAGDAALSQFMQVLQQRDAQQQQQQAALREILMGQLTQASQPVSADSPGIREILSGQRLALQRGAERQRRDSAEMRAYDGSGGVGGKAFQGDVQRILEGQAESDAQFTGQVMNQELNAKRDQLTRLLTLATQLGDAEAARNITAQLNAIQTQLAQSNTYDQLAFNYAGLNSSNNLQTLMALLNAA